MADLIIVHELGSNEPILLNCAAIVQGREHNDPAHFKIAENYVANGTARCASIRYPWGRARSRSGIAPLLIVLGRMVTMAATDASMVGVER